MKRSERKIIQKESRSRQKKRKKKKGKLDRKMSRKKETRFYLGLQSWFFLTNNYRPLLFPYFLILFYYLIIIITLPHSYSISPSCLPLYLAALIFLNTFLIFRSLTFDVISHTVDCLVLLYMYYHSNKPRIFAQVC